MNINLLSFHFDELESLISKLKNDFQIIGISETRLKKTQETITNIQLEIFNVEHVSTDSANGGYQKSNFTIIPENNQGANKF